MTPGGIGLLGRGRLLTLLKYLPAPPLWSACISSISVLSSFSCTEAYCAVKKNKKNNSRNFRSCSRKFVGKNRFRTSFGRRGTSGKSRVMRCQNPSLLRRLATPKTSKKRFGKNSICFGLRNRFFIVVGDFEGAGQF